MIGNQKKRVVWTFTNTIALLGAAVLLAGVMLWIRIYPWSPVDKVLQSMTLNEKICQMMIVRPEQLTEVSTVYAAGRTTERALARYPVGGIIYNGSNLISEEQVKKMLANTQSYSKLGLFLTLNIGVESKPDCLQYGNYSLYDLMVGLEYPRADESKEAVFEYAKALAKERGDLGFNLVLGPMMYLAGRTVNSAELVESAVQGYHAGGVLCSIQDFPGIGHVSRESGLPDDPPEVTLEDIRREKYPLYRAGIAAGADAISAGCFQLDEMGDVPSRSPVWIQDELRGRVGYDGIIISGPLADDIYAVTEGYEDDPLLAVEAGCDMILDPPDLAKAIRNIKEAIMSQDHPNITMKRIDQSVRRILQAKYDAGILKLSG